MTPATPRDRLGAILFLLDLEWRGEAQTDVTIGEYDYGQGELSARGEKLGRLG